MSNKDEMARHVLLVGQLYVDTILSVPHFPEEDSKLRATNVYERTGGNTCNTAQVLAQFHHNVCYMSAVGSRDTSNHVVDLLNSRNLSCLQDTLLYRENATIPSSTIIHNESSGSRTIISHTNVQDITCNEFKHIFEQINKTNRWWVHFEGRNIDNTLQQIDWLDHKANAEHWRDDLIISVELEKPERENIHLLIDRGDVVFFSKLFAQHHGFTDSTSFLINYNLLKEKLKPRGIAFCTWGSKGASVLDNDTRQVKSYTPMVTTAAVIDTVGAGDTFIAGVIASHHSKQTSVFETLQYACDLATKKVSQQGFEGLAIY